MVLQLRPMCLAFALAVTAGPAVAQTWVYESDDVVRVRPRAVYQERYTPRYYDAYAYEPVVTAPRIRVAPAERTVVSRTIIPRGRGRAPIVHERVVTESVAPSIPRAVTPTVTSSYALAPAVTESYAYAPAPRPRIVAQPMVTEPYAAYALAPAARPVVTTVPTVRPYRYWSNGRLLLLDPVTGAIVGED